MSYAKRLFKGTLIIFLMNIVAAFFGYLLRIFLARNLTVAEYGLLYSVIGLLSLLAVVQTLGLGQSLAKFIPGFLVKHQKTKIKTAIYSSIYIQFIVSTIVALITIICANWLSVHFFKTQVAYPILLVCIAFYWISFFESTYSGILQGFQKHKLYSLIGVIRMILIFVAVYLLFISKKSVVFVAVSYLIYYVVAIFLYIPFIKSVFPELFRIKYRKDRELTKKLITFGFPAALNVLGWALLGYIDTSMLTYMKTLDDVGLYNVALPTASMLYYFPVAVSAAILPMVSEMWARNHQEKLKRGLKLIYRYSLVLMIPLIVLMYEFSGYVLSILFGAEYVGAAGALQILSIGALFYAVAYVNFSIISGMGKPSIVTKIILSSVFVNFIGNLFLIPKYGIVGASIMVSAGFLLMMLVSTIYLKKKINFDSDLISFLKLGINAVLLVLFIYLIRPVIANYYLKAGILVVSSVLIYVVLCLVTKTITIKEIKETFFR